MPPKLKVNLDKGAWAWTETTDFKDVKSEHIYQAYRLNLTACEKGTCKRNCKGNPLCLNNIGEKKWYGTIDESRWQNFDPETERRQQGAFVGLKNLGATCYVNTFLQLWFHNPNVRRALYEWRDEYLPLEYFQGWKPDSICGHLQIIFALLELSSRCYIDPSPLIESIGIDTGAQQDAQEFSKLFLHVLESALSGGTPGQVSVIEEQFCGRYSYVTVCQKCCSSSERASTFYELDINIRGHSTLNASIKDFLQEEKLEGDNQYMCSKCESKQNATRAIRLTKLPPVLNLQLMRFVFDKNKGHKKKLSSFIQFPETLDMSPHLRDSQQGQPVYDLTAVLIHRGPTAFSGHYIAHIKQPESGMWHKFNDEEIEKMKNKKLELGKEDDSHVEGTNSEKEPKLSKGQHSSRNAYMLVYTLRQESTPDKDKAAVTKESLPAAVQGFVGNDNDEFEKWIKEMLVSQDNNISEVKQTYEEMKNLYLSLPVKYLASPYEWVTTDWLTKWLAEPAKAEKVNNKVPLCPHGKVLADDVTKLKCVNSEGAALLFAKYPVNKRFPGFESLCERCIKLRCREKQFQRCMADDDKLFTSSKNISLLDSTEELYWVSTKHLRSWKKFAMRELATGEALLSSGPSILGAAKVKFGGDSSPGNTESVCNICVSVCKCDISEKQPLLMESDHTDKSDFLSKHDTVSETNDIHTSTSTNNSKSLFPSSDFTNDLISNQCSNNSNSCHFNVNNQTMRLSPPVNDTNLSTANSFKSILCEEAMDTLIGTKDAHTVCSSSESIQCPMSIDEQPSSSSSSHDLTSCSQNEQLTCSTLKRSNSPCYEKSNNDGIDDASKKYPHSYSQSNKGVSIPPSFVASDAESDHHLSQRSDKSDVCESPDSGVIVFKKSERELKAEMSGSVSKFTYDISGSGLMPNDCNSEVEELCNGKVTNADDGLNSFGEGPSTVGTGDHEDEKEEKFNDDILCEHGNLRMDESGRRAVTQVVWYRLMTYFPHLKSFPFSTAGCQFCLENEIKLQELKRTRREAGQGQKDVLGDLYHGRTRPQVGEDWAGRTAFVVSASFIEGWRKFIKHSMRSESVQEIVNAPLLCEHDLMVYQPEDLHAVDNRFVLVWGEEWDKLTHYFSYDVGVQVLQDQASGGPEGAPPATVYRTYPSVCSTCLTERLRQEEEGKFIFSQQTVYVRRVTDIQGLLAAQKKADEDKGKGYLYDPEFDLLPHQRPPKGPKARGVSPPPEKQPRLDGARKSQRHRKTRGEKEVTVSSCMTLKELKILLFSVCSVPPYDQNLSLDGRRLMEDDTSLQDLKVYPQCVILLQADEPTGDVAASVDEYLSVPTAPEEGFKGTNLLGR